MFKKGAVKLPYVLGILGLLLIAIYVVAVHGAYLTTLILQSSNTNVNLNLTKDNLTLTYTGTDVSKAVYSWMVNGFNILVLNTLTSKNITLTGSNGNVTDFSGNNINGTAYGGAGWVTGRDDGFGAYIFNGSNSSNITFPTLVGYINLMNFSWGAWINASSFPTAGNATIFGQVLANDTSGTIINGTGYSLTLLATGPLVCTAGNSSINKPVITGNETVSNITRNITIFAFCTYDNTTLKLYMNGSLVAQSTLTGGINTSLGGVNLRNFVAGTGDTQIGFSGSIRNLQVWNRTLTAHQIKLMYNGGAGNYSTIHNNETERTEVWNVTVWALNSTGEVNSSHANHSKTSNSINITSGPEYHHRAIPNISMNEDNTTGGFGNITLVEHVSFNLSMYFNDSDGNAITFAINTSASNITNLTVVVNDSGIIRLNASGNYTTIPNGIIGLNYIVFYTNDSSSNSSPSNRVYINVLPQDDDPYLESNVANFSLDEGGAAHSINLSTHFKEVDNDTVTFTYNTTISDVTNLTVTFDQTTGGASISAAVGFVGTRRLQFEVSDGAGNNATSNTVTVTVSRRTTAGGGGAIGGGGGAAAEAPEEEGELVPLESGESKNVGLSEGSSMRFEYKDETHKITAKSVTTTTATIEVESLKRTYVMKLLEKKEIDLDTDGKKDLRVQLMSIEDGKATLSVTLLAPVVLPITTVTPLAEGEEEPTVEPEEAEVAEEPGEEVFDTGGEVASRRISSATWVLLLVVLVVVAVVGYFAYQKKSKK